MIYLLLTLLHINTGLYITAAHIPQDMLPGYTLIYEDEDSDIAYYLNDKRETIMPKIGTVVMLGSRSGKVVKVGTEGFYVELNDNAYKGMSGERVKNRFGIEIGFVSAARPDGTILCKSTLWYVE